MQIPFLLVVFVLAFPIQALTVLKSHVLHEKRATKSTAWIKRDKLSPESTLSMRIGLMQRNLDQGYDFLMDVSHPASKNYGKHWTSEEVINRFAPQHTTVEAVKTWLTDFGIDANRITHSDNKIWFAFDATVDEADRLLAAEYHDFEHASGFITLGCDSYHVPKHISKHVDYITPGVKLFAPPNRRSSKKRGFGIGSGYIPPPLITELSNNFPAFAAGPLSVCDRYITPPCIRALYNITKTPEYPNGKARADNSMGIFEEGDYYYQQDLDYFFGNFTPFIPSGTRPIPAFIDGAFAPIGLQGVGGESLLDFELAYPLIYPQTITLDQTDDLYYATNPNSTSTGGFNTFLDALDGSYCTYSAYGETGNAPIDPVYPDPYYGPPVGYNGPLQCGVYKPTNVISISYGGQEIDLPEYYQRRQCNEFMKLGLQGVSVMFASGDSGVAGPWNSFHPNGCLGASGTVFSPTWPNNCPFVTNVGATKVNLNHTVYQPESAVVDLAGHPYRNAFSSGGGFSNIYGVPEYQKTAVSTYFKNYNPPYPYYRGNSSFGKDGGIYNRVGRGIPDVAAVGDNIVVISSGRFRQAGGTSASTPIFSSLVNRINEQRLNAGKNTTGFLNPALYSNPSMFNDITSGSNPGCGTPGFSAVPGWDPVTGLGTPNYVKMLEFFMSLP